MEINIHIFGTIAGFLTTICFIPQVYKAVKEKHTEGISIPMYIIFITGVFFWFVYGYFLGSTPMIVFNLITVILALIILVTVIRNRN